MPNNIIKNDRITNGSFEVLTEANKIATEKRKQFVIDTNVVLHDSTCIHQFEENDIVVPISVLEELDHFKRGNEQLHFNAREFLRQLDELSNQKSTDDSNLQDQKQGKVRVVVNHNWHPDVEAAFQEDCPDHRILNCAYKLSNNNSGRETILISKDTNMRLKARSLGITAEDYTTDKIMNLDSVYTCLLYTSPSPRDLSTSRMPSSA